MIWLMLATVAFAQDQSLLFLGNSYTGINRLDKLVAHHLEEGAPGWDDVEHQRISSGGWTLSEHAAALLTGPNAHTDALLDGEAQLDYVILQEQGQTSGFDQAEVTWQGSMAGAADLNDAIREHGADTLFFMTWGRRNGDPQFTERYPDYITMQGHLVDGYMAYARTLSEPRRPVFIAPAGPAFRMFWEAEADPEDPESFFWSLYAEDGSHPSRVGSMLAARVFFATITGRTPVGLTFNPAELDDETLDKISEVAHAVVLDQPFQEMRFPFALTWDEYAGDETDVSIGPGPIRYQIRVEKDIAPVALTLNEGALWLQAELQVDRVVTDPDLAELVFQDGSLVVTSEAPTHIEVASVMGAGTLEFTGLDSWPSAEFPATVLTAMDLDADLQVLVPEGFVASVDGSAVILSIDTTVAGGNNNKGRAGGGGDGGCGCTQVGDTAGWIWLLGVVAAMRRRHSISSTSPTSPAST